MAPQVSSSRPILCAVLDGAAFGSDPRAKAEALFRGGVDWIQLRDRSIETDALFGLALAVVAARDAAIADGFPARVIVNRRVDVALAVAADGAHLGFDALESTEVAPLFSASGVVGASLHSVDEIAASLGRALSYAHLAPIWDPISKPATRPALGTDALAQACASGLPILAQGGLNPDRAAQAMRAGAAGIAVTGGLSRSAKPIEAARQLREALDQHIAGKN
jgi:thiamine-phosphate pyrophosphorylase